MSQNTEINFRPDPDQVLQTMADYVLDSKITNTEARKTALYCFLDTLGCGFLALRFPECCKHLGPLVPGTVVPNGARVPGTSFILDPVKAAFDIGCIIRWLDFNDTWLAAEWGHPSDNLGGILAIADYLSRKNLSEGKTPLKIQDILTAMIKAHELQGITALENSFNRVGLDHVLLVRIASTAVVSAMLGASREEIINAISQAWVDGSSLRTYRHSPNAGSRKSWAAGDATSRAVRLAMISAKGEMGIPTVLSTKQWGFFDVSFESKPFVYKQPFGSYVMENILFKISFPAEFHAQTAVEAAVKLHPIVKNRFEEIENIRLETHESAIRIISKSGPLNNPADRDHCLQYMVAVGLAFGNLTAEHYEDDIATMPLLDQLRRKMTVAENKRYTQEYLESDKRSIANSLQVVFKDGSKTEKIAVEYPLGHRKRRSEGIPVLMKKFESAVASRFPAMQKEKIMALCTTQECLLETPVNEFMDLLVI